MGTPSQFLFSISIQFKKKSSLSDQMNNQIGKGPVSSLFVFKKNILRVESSSSKMAIAGALSFLKIINGFFFLVKILIVRDLTVKSSS